MSTIINFRDLPLHQKNTHRMSAIYCSKSQNPKQGTRLQTILQAASFDLERGIYCLTSDDVRLVKKLPKRFDEKTSSLGARASRRYFTNPLLLPERYGSEEFDIETATEAAVRRTNGGFFVVTIEHDCQTVTELDEIIHWTGRGEALSEVDARLCNFKDYKGCSAVFSGNKSVHFHFIFDTRHLLNAPHNHSWAQRIADHQAFSALMANAHEQCWEFVAKHFVEVANAGVDPDKKLKDYSQWRRCPWGLREIDDPKKNLLGVQLGQFVPQIVLYENIRPDRAPKGSKEFAVDPALALPLRATASGKRAFQAKSFFHSGDRLIPELAKQCEAEWGCEYPKPVSLNQDNGEWVVRFMNHEGDRNPSTIVRGHHSRLLIQGCGLEGSFILPGSLTAQETGNDLALRYGLISECVSPCHQTTETTEHTSITQTLKRGISIKDQIESAAARSMPIPISTAKDELKYQYLEKLGHALARATGLDRDTLVLSGEGIGKSRYFFRRFANDALDTAMRATDGQQRFSCFAFRSIKQAEQKTAEYTTSTTSAVVIKSFWRHYQDACIGCGVDPLAKSSFDEPSNINSVLQNIRQQDEAVYAALEATRQRLWMRDGISRYDCGTTLLFTTHETVKTWTTSRLTKTWHNPAFRPLDFDQDFDALRYGMHLQQVAYDDPEAHDFVHIIPGAVFDHLKSVEGTAWRNLSAADRRSLQLGLMRSGKMSVLGFEEYDALRHLNLNGFEEVVVDFDALPFGRENSLKAIYKRQHGERYFVRPQDWPFNSNIEWTFLTTERWVAEMISTAYRKRSKTLMRLELDDLPGVYPLRIPLVYDKRANAQSVSKLASEIMKGDTNAIVIADSLGKLKGPRAMSYQAMKGLNNLSSNNVAAIVQYLAPEVYAKLNVLGQWAGQSDAVAMHYAGIMNQAAGRNSGFRQEGGTKTFMVASAGLMNLIGGDLAAINRRMSLHPTAQRFW